MKLLQEHSDTYPGSAPILAAHELADPLKPVVLKPSGYVWLNNPIDSYAFNEAHSCNQCKAAFTVGFFDWLNPN